MSTPTDGTARRIEHPGWCEPKECRADSPDLHQQHRSTPSEFRLQEDVLGTRLVARVAESVCAPGKLALEVEVFSDDSDEPHEELRIGFTDLLGLARFSLGVVADAVVAEAQPVEYSISKAA